MPKQDKIKFRKQFTSPLTGKITSIFFGEMSPSDAARAKEYIERLIVCRKFGTMPDETVVCWLDGLSDKRYDKLAKVGLVSGRSRTTLKNFIDAFVKKLDVAKNTLDNYLSSKETLIIFFGEDCKPETLTKQDAEAFRDYLKTSGRLDGKGGYGKNSVWKKLQHANVFFQAMQDDGLVRSNPFAKVKESPEHATDRKFYIPEDYVRKALEAAPSWEWKLLIALWRFGGMRRACEPLRLRWSDVDWHKKLIRVFSSKTKQERFVPIFPEIMEPLQKVYEKRDPEWDWVLIETCPARFRYCRDRADGLKNAGLGKRFDDICRKAGLPIMVFAGNNMRASCEKDLYGGKYPELRGRIDAIAQILGHSPATALKYYTRFCTDDLQRLTDSFDNAFAVDGRQDHITGVKRVAESPSLRRMSSNRSVKKRVKQEEKEAQSGQGFTQGQAKTPCFAAPKETECKAKQNDYPRQDSNL